MVVQLKHSSEIGPIEVYSKHQEEEGSQGSGAASHLVAGALTGVLRRGGGRRRSGAGGYRGVGGKAKAPARAGAHREAEAAVCKVGEAPEAANRRRRSSGPWRRFGDGGVG